MLSSLSCARVSLCVVLCAVAAGACRTVDAPAQTRLVLSAEDGAVVFDSASSFVLRHPEHVVPVRPLGEIHLGVDGDPARCRLVWSKDGLDALSLLEGERCPRVEGDRVCFDATRFVTNGRVPTVVARGCAWENNLKWSKLQGPQAASVGPTSWRRRCVDVPAPAKTCEHTFLRVVEVDVVENAAPREGFFFAHDADAWRACFLEKQSGGYRVVLDVEDSCGGRQQLTVQGDSRDLDD